MTYTGPVDTFTGPSYDPVWSVSGGCAIVSARSRHTIDTSYDGEISTGNSYALVDSQALVEVEIDVTGDNRDVYFFVGLNGAHRALFELVGSTLYFVAGGSDTNIVYDATAHRWWRIVESSGNLSFDTSPDGTTWTTRRTVIGHGMDLSVVRVLLGAGRNTAVGAPFYAYFDNLNSPPVGTAHQLAGTTGLTTTPVGALTVARPLTGTTALTTSLAGSLTVAARVVLEDLVDVEVIDTRIEVSVL
jgi:hypothetical protein